MKSLKTSGVCAKEISIKLENDIITQVKFHGGCDGNTSGLEILIVGQSKDEIIKKLKGIDCKGRGTSCPDQLAQLLEKY
ncbi:TIGR03905 family TSCPD domain-containing protein [Cetobacterium sp. 2A]|uniref:TIGR03905 family TSCPD domain-containing protein n=1 Tax=unclassified Cetobacterium TaxID=2630983 RepID=UPI00163C79F1|nr:TIGR03905 family TSCPD domain-containing protein [Cetobacterium sp. 2A]MBC2857146.1 TIGR03905 family TSCPD domain-containing protein [Cetobacterium sp. 2A]